MSTITACEATGLDRVDLAGRCRLRPIGSHHDCFHDGPIAGTHHLDRRHNLDGRTRACSLGGGRTSFKCRPVDPRRTVGERGQSVDLFDARA